jgi:hypothetical protein
MSDAADMIPRSRLNEEIAKRKELEADLAKFKVDLTTAQAAAAEAETLRATLAKVQGEHETFKAGVDAGITDPEGLELARWLYDKIPAAEDGTRPTFAAYLGGLKSDPAARPKALTGYFTDAPTAAPAPAGTPAAPPAGQTPATPAQAAPKPAAPRSAAPLPAANTGATPPATPAPTPAGWTAEAISRLPKAQYEAHKAEIAKEHGATLLRMIAGQR